MNIIAKAEIFAKEEYKKNDPMHRWKHIEKVRKRAHEIAMQLSEVDYELLDLAIIFHDIDYNSEDSVETNYTNHVDNSVKVAKKFLTDNNYPRGRILKILRIILDHSTPHRRKRGDAKTIEGKIIYDADKSIFITTRETYDKYFQRLYLEATRELVNNQIKE